jgi:D-amino-acid dehydrogenase
MKTAVVLGAGMVGVSTALALVDRGWSVVLVDRKPPGQETSFGNAGIIQSEAVEPYPMPRSIRELFDIAIGRTNDVHYTLRELPAHLGSLARYWWHSQTTRHQVIAAAWAGLIGHATSTHGKLIERAGAGNLIRKSGYRVLYRSQAEYDAGIVDAERIFRIYGVKSKLLSSDAMAQAEPSLTVGGVGAIHWPDSWTASNPGGLASSYSALFERCGGTFVRGSAETVKRTGSGWSVEADNGPVEAEHVVVSLGPWSADLLQTFGHHFPMVRKRGYHAHYRSPQPLQAPVMDTAFGYVLAPMQGGMRITTGAHLARPETPAAYNQLERAEAAARQLMDLGERIEDRPWQGTRPCMPDMLPVIGQSQHQPGLWMNFGHGHQGFTLGPATGDVLASLMSGETPFVDMKPFRPERY